MKKLSILFLCGVLAGCQMQTMPEKVEGINYQSKEVAELVNQMNSNEYGKYLLARADEHGVIINFDPSYNLSASYNDSTQTITLKDLSATNLAHEITHLIQYDNGYFDKARLMSKDENTLMCLMAEFDARFKADYFYSNGTLDKKAYLEALVDCFNYKFYSEYYAKNETGKDLFDPKDLTPLIDQNFVNYDVNVVLEQIKQKRSLLWI